MEKEDCVAIYEDQPLWDEYGGWRGKSPAYGLKQSMFPGIEFEIDKPIELLTEQGWRQKGASRAQVAYSSEEEEVWEARRFDLATSLAMAFVDNGDYAGDNASANILAEKSVKITDAIIRRLRQ